MKVPYPIASGTFSKKRADVMASPTYEFSLDAITKEMDSKFAEVVPTE